MKLQITLDTDRKMTSSLNIDGVEVSGIINGYEVSHFLDKTQGKPRQPVITLKILAENIISHTKNRPERAEAYQKLVECFEKEEIMLLQDPDVDFARD